MVLPFFLLSSEHLFLAAVFLSLKTITKMLKFKLKQDREKKFMADLKRIYKANNKELAAEELDILAATWNDSYPIVIKSWRSN
ncbi:MAG: transposase, partial [Desulfocapsaceae bacterium]|nr:transposase [Desulfocapsaceae bacterium]